MSDPHASTTVLAGLKDFQRKTVEYAFARMFAPERPATRFLVADEVGLGKTLVARGLIAKTVEHLQGTAKRIDIIYVCSNADIAAQNLDRLMLPGCEAFTKATRLTLLPLVTEDLRKHKVNFISFTPGTTFNPGNRTGRWEERRLIWQMLQGIGGIDRRGLLNALTGTMEWSRWVEQSKVDVPYDRSIAERFCSQVAGDPELMSQIASVALAFHDRRRTLSSAETEACLQMTGVLRRTLAKACLDALEPDLVILDEFQRFGELLDSPEASLAAELAHDLFNYSEELRVLLLSATPYKMYVRDDDSEDHYADFLRTARFLMHGNEAVITTLNQDIERFRTSLLSARSEEDIGQLQQTRARIEAVLKSVMCRTERVGATLRADAMVKERRVQPALEASDIREFGALDLLARRLKEPEPMEYWKSAPYLVNFMRTYELKRAVTDDLGRRVPLVADLLDGRQIQLLAEPAVQSFRPMSAANPKVRALLDEIDRSGLWRLLWMPPALPYWRPAGAYEDAGAVTKLLVFSAWNVVPDALAGIVSYEVERRLVHETNRRVSYSAMPKRFAAKLRFSRQADRLSGMSALLLMFPSRALVSLVDPACVANDASVLPSFAEVRQSVASKLAPLLEAHVDRSVQDGAADRRWYWLALARLEQNQFPDTVAWCKNEWSCARVDSEEEAGTSAFAAHVTHWLEALGPLDSYGLGRVPTDLAEVLADVALSGAANCALRTLMRQWPDLGARSCLNASVRVAEGLRRQFNTPHAVALLKAADDEDSHWQQVLRYCADGNLQALLDEHAHVMAEDGRVSRHTGRDAVNALADAMFEGMTLRTANLRPDRVATTDDGAIKLEPFHTALRTHFAVRFGAQDEESGAVARKEAVQAAFNSPFWPFVLASTSTGQEGLDFHKWCHAVVHWNVPSNPVDMEQREGRVHRYKGYAVRKNVAQLYGREAFQADGNDRWQRLFELAVEKRSANMNDLVPYWICEAENGAAIERRIMALPMSRDEARYRRLSRSLALYRMVFAQPRQEDLLACLEQSFGTDSAAEIARCWRISLEP